MTRALAYGVTGLFLAAHLVVPELATRRWWGLDVLGAWGPAARVVFAILAVVAMVAPLALPAVIGSRGRALKAAPGRFPALAAVLVALPLLWCLRSGSDVWGDGVMRLEELGHVHYDWRFGGAEPLDGFIHDAVFRATHLAPRRAWAVVSVVAGALLALLAIPLARRTGRAWIGTGFLLSTGAMALFCGHLESYSLAPVVILAYVLVLFRMFEGRMRPALSLPLAAWLLVTATLLHVSSLYLLPSFMWLAGRTLLARGERGAGRAPGERAATPARASAALSMLAILVFTAWKLGDLRSLSGSSALGLGGDEPAVHAYGLLSRAHFIDLANFLLLLAPLPAMVFFAGLPAFIARVRDREAGGAGIFLAILAGGALALFFGLDPRLGSRDWDLMTFPAFPLALLTGGWTAAWASGAAWRSRFAATAILAAALHAAFWVGALASPERAMVLAERMIADDPHHAGGGRLWFAAYLDRAGLIDRAIVQYRIAGRDPAVRARALFGEGQALRHAGREDEGAARLAEACAADPMYIPAHVVLGDLELARGRWSAARDHFEAALRVSPENLEWWLAAAAAGTRREDLASALDLERRAAQRVLPDHEIRSLIGLGVALIQLGQDQSAAQFLGEATRRDPRNASARLQYARALVTTNPAAAADELRIAAGLDPGSAEIHFRLATVLETLGRTAEAAAEYRETLRREPTKAAEFCTLGARALAAGRPDEARQAYSIALKLDPSNTEALAALARTGR